METELFKKLTELGRLYMEISKVGEETMYKANVTWVAPGMNAASASIQANGGSTVLSECLQAVLNDFNAKKAILIAAVSQ